MEWVAVVTREDVRFFASLRMTVALRSGCQRADPNSCEFSYGRALGRGMHREGRSIVVR